MKRSRERDDMTEPDPHGSSPSSSPDPDTPPGPAAKVVELDSSTAENEHKGVAMKCSLPPHKEALTFQTYDEYEVHYNKAHLNRCLDCQNNFPSEHLLNVHFEECHDPFAAVKRDRGEQTYSCFVESCDRKCRTPQKRRLHLIDKHMYPKNFFFAVTRDGIDGRRSLLLEGGHHQRRRSSTTFRQSKENRRRASLVEGSTSTGKQAEGKAGSPTQETVKRKGGTSKGHHESANESANGDVHEQDMDDLAGAMSSLQFVPSNIRFGRGGGHAGFARK